MAVGFGYIRDDKPTQVDWGQITKDANASLKDIEKDRQGRRDKIDENQRAFTKMLAERPTGGDVVYQKWMGKYSAMTSAAMLENLNKLKRGDIGEQEFNTFRATVASGVEGMIATGKGYIAGYDKAAELQVGNGSALTKWQNTQSQLLFDLENVEPYIDPITGETTYFLLKEDGEKEVVNVSQGLRRVVATAEAFDTEGAIDEILKAPINEFQNNLGGTESGQFLTREMVDGVEQIVVNSDYIRTSARSAVQQGSHVFDILNLDKTGYEIAALPTEYYALNTQEERDAYLKELHKDTSVLYVDKNDRPLESEAQRKEAEDYIVEQVKDGAQMTIKDSPYKAKEIIDLDIEWRESSIAKTNAEANAAGKSRVVPALRNYSESFFPADKLNENDLESTIVAAFQNFDYRNIKIIKTAATATSPATATILYTKPSDTSQTRVNFNLTDDYADLQKTLGELLIRQRGFDQLVDDAIFAGALDDTKPMPGAD